MACSHIAAVDRDIRTGRGRSEIAPHFFQRVLRQTALRTNWRRSSSGAGEFCTGAAVCGTGAESVNSSARSAAAEKRPWLAELQVRAQSAAE